MRAAARRALLLAALVLAAGGCAASAPRYRDEARLKSLVLGQSKVAVVETFGARDVDPDGKAVNVAPLRMRAAQRTETGDLFEIGEVFLVNRTSGRVSGYWFLFKNGRLAMWGRAEDWKLVKGGVPLTFEPARPPQDRGD